MGLALMLQKHVLRRLGTLAWSANLVLLLFLHSENGLLILVLDGCLTRWSLLTCCTRRACASLLLKEGGSGGITSERNTETLALLHLLLQRLLLLSLLLDLLKSHRVLAAVPLTEAEETQLGRVWSGGRHACSSCQIWSHSCDLEALLGASELATARELGLSLSLLEERLLSLEGEARALSWEHLGCLANLRVLSDLLLKKLILEELLLRSSLLLLGVEEEGLLAGAGAVGWVEATLSVVLVHVH